MTQEARDDEHEAQVQADIREGLRQSAAGAVHDLGSFAVYVEREALIQLIDGCIPDDLPGYRQRYTDRAADAILAAGYRNLLEPEITDEMVDAACEAWSSEPLTLPGEGVLLASRRYMRAALEAALWVPVSDSVSREGDQ